MKIFLLTTLGLIIGISSQSQTITTVAGGGVGDGLSAITVPISPSSIAVDASGNIYIIDGNLSVTYGNNRIRKINATTGIITTVAGNGALGYSGDGSAATSAALSDPCGIAVDKFGNLYIAESLNERIRKVNAATGIITTVAGNGTQGYSGDGSAATSAQLDNPNGVAVDAAGNLYIADGNNNRIRKVNVTTGIITTVAGNGNQGYSGDGGAATSAQLAIAYQSGLAVDAAGNIYIADCYNNRIRKVNAATKIITTVAGNGTQGYSGDGGAATSAQLDWPWGVAVDASGNIYIADEVNNRIRKVTAATGIITTVAGNGTWGYSGDGGAATSAEMSGPTGVALNATGNLYIVDHGSCIIRKVDATTGIITTVAGDTNGYFWGDGIAATSSKLDSPYGVAIDATGNIYIADEGNNRIRKVTAATGIISTVAGNGIGGYSGDGDAATSAEMNRPGGVALDAAGNLYIADIGNNRIRKVDATSGIITTVAGNGTQGYSGDGDAATSAQLAWPYGVAIDAAGNLYIADYFNYRIRKVDAATGVITTVAGNGTKGYSGDGDAATSAQLAWPTGVAVDVAGNLFIADKNNQRIRKVDAATGVITTVAGNGTYGYSGDGGPATSAQLNFPYGMAVDAAGDLYIADRQNNRIRKVDAATGTITTIAGNNFGGYWGDVGAATSISLNYPSSVALDAAGNLFIADEGNNRIRKVVFSPSGIGTVDVEQFINVFPNPTTCTITISGLSELSKGSAIYLHIMDVSGKIVLTKKVDSPTGSETIDTGSLAPGVYLISIQTDTQRVAKRFVKQ